MAFIPENLSTKQKVLAGVAVVALAVGGFLAYRAVVAPSGLPPVNPDQVGGAGEVTSNTPATPAPKGTTQPPPKQDDLPEDLRGGQRTAPR